MECLREFNDTILRQDCSTLTGTHQNKLFHECTFKELNGLSLIDCVLTGSRLLTDKIRSALNFSLTLNCNSFRDVEYSPLLFDLLLCLMVMSKGNDSKRAALIDIIGKHRHRALDTILRSAE